MKLTSASRRPWTLFLTLTSLALPAQAEVWVVDVASGPGSDFTDIQSAVDAASDGDTVLVRDGTYLTQFDVVGKSLSVVADGSDVHMRGSISSYVAIEVRDLAQDQSVLIRGIQVEVGLGVLDCEGAVWFDDVDVTGDVACALGGTAGAFVSNSHEVTFTHCSLRGESANDYWFNHPSADGLQVQTATVQLFDCDVQGGWGLSIGGWASVTALPGGAGIRLDQSTVTVIGCTIQGGEGGLGGSPCAGGTNAFGGPGVEFVSGTSTLHSAESTAVGGVADLDPLCPGQFGPQGPPIAGSGTIVPLTGFARHLQANAPVRGGETLTLDVEGIPGEIPLLLVSLEHEPVTLLNYSSILLVGFPISDLFVLPALPGTGQASLSFPAPNIGAVTGAMTFYAQAVFLDPSPQVWLGAGTSVVLLDSTF